MAKEAIHVTKGGHATVVGKGSRSQETLFTMGYEIVDPMVALRLGWFKPLRCGSHNQTVYGLEYGLNKEHYLRF